MPAGRRLGGDHASFAGPDPFTYKPLPKPLPPQARRRGVAPVIDEGGLRDPTWVRWLTTGDTGVSTTDAGPPRRRRHRVGQLRPGGPARPPSAGGGPRPRLGRPARGSAGHDGARPPRWAGGTWRRISLRSANGRKTRLAEGASAWASQLSISHGANSSSRACAAPRVPLVLADLHQELLRPALQNPPPSRVLGHGRGIHLPRVQRQSRESEPRHGLHGQTQTPVPAYRPFFCGRPVQPRPSAMDAAGPVGPCSHPAQHDLNGVEFQFGTKALPAQSVDNSTTTRRPSDPASPSAGGPSTSPPREVPGPGHLPQEVVEETDLLRDPLSLGDNTTAEAASQPWLFVALDDGEEARSPGPRRLI